MNQHDLVLEVIEQYLQTERFNGLSAHNLIRAAALDSNGLRKVLQGPVKQGLLSLRFGEGFPNPHIRAFADPPVTSQLERLNDFEGDGFVVYPTAKALKDHVDSLACQGCPFTRRLALGEPQLSYESFELAVLDRYRRDPRYQLWTNDVTVTLAIGDKEYEDASFPERDKVLIQQFGFSYDSIGRRAVAVFLCDLAGLTPERPLSPTSTE